jgi:hypothetical protein
VFSKLALNSYGRIDVRKFLRKIQFSKGIVRCIIKVEKEGDVFEYKGADTSK